MDPSVLPADINRKKLAKRAQLHIMIEYFRDKMPLHLDTLSVEQKLRLLWLNRTLGVERQLLESDELVGQVSQEVL